MGSGVSSSLITHPNWIYLTNRINLISCLALYTLIGVNYASSFSNVLTFTKQNQIK